MLARLAPTDVSQRLASLHGWELSEKTIRKNVRLADFRAAMAFVHRVADLAEAADHHPDILIHYREVTLVLWTHVVDGLTEHDFALAADIDRID